MRNPLRIVVPVVAAAALSGCLVGQGELRLRMPATVTLVTVEPGVQVVEDYDEEVFYVDGQYWVRRSDFWYRAGDPHARWSRVEPRYVPVVLVRSPPGRYAHRRGAAHDRSERHGEGHQDGAVSHR